MKNIRYNGLNVCKCPPSPTVCRNYSEGKLNPHSVTGFSDGEACFILSILKSRTKSGFSVVVRFKISLHEKDRALLESLKAYFNGVGSITKHGENAIQYRVNSQKDLMIIIDHFYKYPLITQKWADYALFKHAFNLISSKEHLTAEGLQKLVAIKASMNNGLTEELKAAFPNTIPFQRPKVMDGVIKDPRWVAVLYELKVVLSLELINLLGQNRV
jgi:hypothetical protein